MMQFSLLLSTALLLLRSVPTTVATDALALQPRMAGMSPRDAILDPRQDTTTCPGGGVCDLGNLCCSTGCMFSSSVCCGNGYFCLVDQFCSTNDVGDVSCCADEACNTVLALGYFVIEYAGGAATSAAGTGVGAATSAVAFTSGNAAASSTGVVVASTSPSQSLSSNVPSITSAPGSSTASTGTTPATTTKSAAGSMKASSGFGVLCVVLVAAMLF